MTDRTTLKFILISLASFHSWGNETKGKTRGALRGIASQAPGFDLVTIFRGDSDIKPAYCLRDMNHNVKMIAVIVLMFMRP
jgi:hypothetical protein